MVLKIFHIFQTLLYTMELSVTIMGDKHYMRLYLFPNKSLPVGGQWNNSVVKQHHEVCEVQSVSYFNTSANMHGVGVIV